MYVCMVYMHVCACVPSPATAPVAQERDVAAVRQVVVIIIKKLKKKKTGSTEGRPCGRVRPCASISARALRSEEISCTFRAESRGAVHLPPFPSLPFPPARLLGLLLCLGIRSPSICCAPGSCVPLWESRAAVRLCAVGEASQSALPMY